MLLSIITPLRRVAVRALVFQEGEWLSAQCLEYDIATQARTLADLWYELQRIIAGHIATSLKDGKSHSPGVPPAPKKFWRMFERSKIPLAPPPMTFKLRRRDVKIVAPQVRVAVAA
jgi:hypothetical protein